MSASVSSITIYPIKSTAGTSLNCADVERRGLSDDRRWLVVDARGEFMTGRKHPRMLLMAAAVRDRALSIEAPGMPPLAIDDARGQGPASDVQIWRDRVSARAVAPEADAWLSDFLGVECQLVYMPSTFERAVDPDFARPGDSVSFADGYPLLLIGDASLADLNTRAPIEVEMRRFRPNVTVAGCAPFAEDIWRRIRIGDVIFEGPKLCDRCVMTTIDPQRAAVHPDKEPLRTLAGYRRHPQAGILFGLNLIPRSGGTISVGDPIEVLE